MVDWDYSSDYCEACAELGLTTCSCESDEPEIETCDNCGQEMSFYTWNGLCDDCEEGQEQFECETENAD